MTTDARLYVHVVLDRSGSMEDCRDKTIDAFNEYVGSLRAQSKAGTQLSLTTFDSESIDKVIDCVRIADVAKLTRDTFVPRGMTPLFDAIGHAVAATDKVTLLPDERVALAILTDGLENASREMTADAVRKLLTDRQERCNWLVQYLGANQDAWSVGEQIGVGRAHAMDYDVGSIAPAMQSAAASMLRYRASPKAESRRAASFSAAERMASKSDANNKA
jgi:hypothetical protein